MRMLVSALALLGLSAASPAQDLAITDVTVISPERSAPLTHATVLIEGDRITGILPAGATHDAAEEINGSGRYLIPGLIDSHVHLYHATGLRRGLVPEDRHAALLDAFLEQMPRSYLYWGFTTLVELNADFETNAEFLDRPVRPDLFHCAEGLITSNGFMASQAGDHALDVFPNYLHDRHVTPQLPSGEDPARHTPAATLDAIAAAGGSCVKIYYEEAPWLPDGPDWPLPSLDIFREVATEAEARGMPVFLHGTTATAMQIGLEAGVDAMAHGPWEMDVDLMEPDVPQAMMDVADRIASSPMRVQPTLRTIGQTRSMFEPAILDDPAWADVVPQSFLDYLQSEAQSQRDQFVGFFVNDRLPLDQVPVAMGNYRDRYYQVLARIEAQSDNLVFATDTAVGTFGWGNPPGLNGYWEMRELAAAGVSPADILDMATRRNAELLRISADLGTVEAGKRANLLLLAENPLESVEAYASLQTIILGGRVIDRTALSARNYSGEDS